MIFADVEQQYRDMKEIQKKTKNCWSNSLSQLNNDQMLQLRSYIIERHIKELMDKATGAGGKPPSLGTLQHLANI